MTKEFMKRNFVKLLVAAGAALPLTGCVDDSYDLSKDVDLTMGLGSDGLGLRLGDTEKIMLGDLLETDASLHTQAGTNIYYLVKDGSSKVNFNINPTVINIDNALLKTTQDVITFDNVMDLLGLSGVTEVPVQGGFDLTPNETFTASAPLNYASDPLDPAIHALRKLTPAAGTAIEFVLSLDQPDNFRFVLKEVKELTIKFPTYLKLKGVDGVTKFDESTGELTFLKPITNISKAEHSLGKVLVECIQLDGKAGEVNANNRLEIIDERISMIGSFSFGTNGSFTMKSGDKVKLHLAINVGNPGKDKSSVNITEAVGRFSPDISPTLEKINVSDNLPDFLQDEDVTVKVANPTLKLSADMSNIPSSLNISADLYSVKAGNAPIHLAIPNGQTAFAQKGIYNTLYFYQDNVAGPFDPDGLPATYSSYHVPGISTLIEKLPDYIEVKVNDHHITFADEDCTLKMNHEYKTEIFYNLLVPFTFEEGLCIVYTDSVTDMNEDLKDFAAENLVVTANILNAVPLELEAKVEVLDLQGNIIEGIEVTPAMVAPANKGNGSVDANATTTPVEIGIALSDGNLLKKVNALRFRIEARGKQQQSGAYLTSKQYIKVTDMRLQLKGQVVGDFNDDEE